MTSLSNVLSNPDMYIGSDDPFLTSEHAVAVLLIVVEGVKTKQSRETFCDNQ